MIHSELHAALSAQIGYELRASHQYLAMSIAMNTLNLDGFATFFAKQSEEERSHALKIIGFLNDVGKPAQLTAIEAVKTDFNSVLEAVKTSLEYEKRVTASFKHMTGLAFEKSDFVSLQFLGWFLTEQIEEEASFAKLQAILESGLNPFQAQALLPQH